MSFGQALDRQADDFRRTVLAKTALVFRLAAKHELSNTSLARPINDLLALMNPLLQEGESIRLEIAGEHFFINKEHVRLDFSAYESAQILRGIMKRVGVAEIGFDHPLAEAELREFLAVFQHNLRSSNPARFAEQMFAKIAVRPISAAGVTTDDLLAGGEHRTLIRTYAVIVLALREALEDLARGRPPKLAKLKRAIHALATASLDRDPQLAAITRLTHYTGDVAAHSAAVCAFTLMMCRRLALPAPVLSELCLAALLHHVGRARVPAELEGGSDPAALAEALRRVPLASFLEIAAAPLSPQILAYACASHEHQLPISYAIADREGLTPSATARMIAVPCAFDLMTCATPPRRALANAQAMWLIGDEAGRRFDPTVARLFISTLGPHFAVDAKP